MFLLQVCARREKVVLHWSSLKRQILSYLFSLLLLDALEATTARTRVAARRSIAFRESCYAHSQHGPAYRASARLRHQSASLEDSACHAGALHIAADRS